MPSSPDAIEVRVFGAWLGATVPPPVELVVGDSRTPALPDAPAAGAPPSWSAAFLAPIDVRAAVEAGEASIEAGDAAVRLSAGVPGPLPGHEAAPGGTLVDPAVLAERRARRAELAEQSGSGRAATADQTVATLRMQLGHLEERLAGAASERDRLAARVADAERRLRLAEQREEAERRRRAELEEETLAARREAETELQDLRGRLAGAEEVAAAIEQELGHARRRRGSAERAAADERAARRAVEAALAAATERVAALEDRLATAAEPGAREQALAAHVAVVISELRSGLDAARSDAAQLRESLTAAEADLAQARADPAAGRRPELEARIRELADEVAAIRGRVRDATADLELQLAHERLRRHAAEDLLAHHRSERPPAPHVPETGPDVDPATRPDVSPDAGPDVEPDAGGENTTDPPADPGDTEAAGLRPPAPRAPDERTRVRLAAIEADLRAAVPDPSDPTPARDVIASLQRAADRLRAAAEEELEALEAAPARPVALGARPAVRREGAWLRAGLERLAATDAALGTDLLAALLPAQALVADRLTYDLAPHGGDRLRVALDAGVARVERPPASAVRPAAVVAGSAAALAPLAAGGASWRLPGLQVDGSRTRMRRLAWARRRPVTLGDLVKVTPAPDPRLLLGALAAAVDPAWTRGERLAVAFAFEGDGRWSVLADDGAPLRIESAGARAGDATVHTGPEGLLALLAGREQPKGRPATVEGDVSAVGRLLGWFDRARAGEGPGDAAPKPAR